MNKLLLFAVAILATISTRAQWEPDVRLTNDPSSSLTKYSGSVHTIATSGDTVHVVWYDNRDGNNCEIYYKRSIDGGFTWGEDIRLTNDPSYSWGPSIAVSGSVVHMTWEDYRNSDWEIYYKRSTDGGNSWGPDTRISYHTGNSWHPAIVISNEIVIIAWYEYEFIQGTYDIFYKRSTDGGLSWGSEVRLTNYLTAAWPSICATGPVIHIAWYDQHDGNVEIYYKRSMDGGISWEADTRLTNDPAKSIFPCISVNDSIVHVVWHDIRDGNNEIYYKRSADAGLTWGQDIRLTNSTGDSQFPSIVASGPVVHVVWYDDRVGNLEIYYKRSDDEGINWGSDIRLTHVLGDSEYPNVAISGPMVHVVWTDLRDGNEEIYYKRDPTGGFAVGTNNELTGSSGQQISIYPNPASSSFRVSYRMESNPFSGRQNIDRSLTVRNFLGEEVLREQLQYDDTIIDVSNLQNGIYFVGITTANEQTVCTKLIILK